jgi:plasmid maintenance system antidote protein VapI
MKQAEVAQKLNISQSLVSQILSGKRAVSKEFAIKMAEAFGGDPSKWVFATPDEIRAELIDSE